MSIRKLICGDCRDAVKELAPGSVDLIYLDPPFNSKKQYNLPFKKMGRDVKAVAAFKDIWHWDDATRELYRELGCNPLSASPPPPKI